MTPDATRCVESGCPEEGVVGLNGAWLCLMHFDIRFTAMKAPLHKASSSRRLASQSDSRRRLTQQLAPCMPFFCAAYYWHEHRSALVLDSEHQEI